MCLNSNGIATHVNFNESSFSFQTYPKFISSKLAQSSKPINTFSKFITVSFPSESHSHEVTSAGSNSSENPIQEITHFND